MSEKDRKALGVTTSDEREKKAFQGLERELQRLCEHELSRRGVEYLHLSFRAREKAGWPDITACYLGVPLSIEIKTGSYGCTKEQLLVHYRLRNNGWRVEVVRSYGQFVEILDGILHEKQLAELQETRSNR